MAKSPPPVPTADGGDEQTSVRVSRADAVALKQLAALMDVSIPDAYRAVCAPVVSAALIAAAERTAREQRRGQGGRSGS